MKNYEKPLPNKGYPEGLFAAGIPLGEFPAWRTFVRCPTNGKTAPALRHCLRAISRDFFGLQSAALRRRRTVPVVSVDHPLDALIPFRPELADRYLDFIFFWIRGLSMCWTTLGTKRGAPPVRRFLEQLTVCYKESARLYTFRLSTTVRPPTDHPRMKQIRAADPHWCCVPSLHVTVVCLTWAFFRALFRNEAASFAARGVSGADTDRYEAELRRGAVTIIETVLYVKQHSVNCIPAALYLLCSVFPELFSIADAVSIINSLFAADRAVEPSVQIAIASHIHFQFERLLLAGCYSDDWTDPVKQWLETYTFGG